MKKLISLVMVLVLALALVACGGTEEPSAPDNTTPDSTTPSTTPQEEQPLRVCFVAELLGDNSFSDSCDSGLKEAERDFGIIYDCQQVGSDGRVNAIREAAQNGYDIVVSGYDADNRAMLDAEAGDYPDTIFFLYECTDMDYTPPENVLCVVFSANESDFVCGAIAAKQSESKVTGWVGGQECTSLYDFLIGWVAGVNYADDTATTAYSFVAGDSPWSDPAKAKELTKSLYNNFGADVMHGVAGQSGDGVIEAVLELREATGKNIWDIGVDCDQYAVFMENEKEDKAEVILTSSVKKVGQPVYDLVKKILDGQTPELGLQTYGIAEGAAGNSDNDFYRANASADALAVASQITDDILSGSLSVDTAFGKSLDEINAIFKETTVNFIAVTG